MGRKADLSHSEISRVEALLRTGQYTMQQIAQQCDVSRGSVLNIKQRLAANISGPSRRGRCGTKRKTTARQDRLMVRILRQRPLLSAGQVMGELKQHGVNVTTRTIQRRLKELGCRSVRPRKVPKLTPAMMKKRLAFAKTYVAWTVDDWRKVAFSDESTFECQLASARRQWQTPLSLPPVRQSVKHPTKVMVWSMISHSGLGRLHICEGMMTGSKYMEVLQHRMLPQLRAWYVNIDDCFFMQDGAPCHTAKICTRYLVGEGVRLLLWPGNSPDMNPIENVWGFVKKMLAQQTLNTHQQLIAALIKVWIRDASLLQKVQASIDSMPNRIAAVIAAKGGHTKY